MPARFSPVPARHPSQSLRDESSTLHHEIPSLSQEVKALHLQFNKWYIFRVQVKAVQCGRRSQGSMRCPRGLLVRHAERKHAQAIVRGLCAVSDFEYEFQLALMNRKLSRSIETFFLMTARRYLYVSSRILKATVVAGGSPKGLVPDYALKVLKKKFSAIEDGENQSDSASGEKHEDDTI